MERSYGMSIVNIMQMVNIDSESSAKAIDSLQTLVSQKWATSKLWIPQQVNGARLDTPGSSPYPHVQTCV